jgi:hypothetical protein
MEVVRYRPGEAIRWLATGAENFRKDAASRGRAAVKQPNSDARAVKENLKNVAGAVLDFGKGAYADLLHNQAEASEYVLLDHQFDVVRGGTIRSVPYSDVKKIEYRSDKATLVLEKGSLTIKPVAHIVAGHAKVAVGWARNEIEVPYELLIEELAARCKCEIDG